MPAPRIAMSTPRQAVEIDTSVASEARVYDYLLGGTDNFDIDRMVAARQGEAVGGIDNARAAVRANRVFLREVMRYLVGAAGVRQFLDVGSGIPTQDNVHEVAQAASPDCRILYVDYDPVVLAHAHKLLRSTPEGAADFVLGDFRDADRILDQARHTLDFGRPVALMLVSFLHFFSDAADPQATVARLVTALPAGSYLVVSHLTADREPEKMRALTEAPGDDAQYEFIMRSHDEVAAFFSGLEFTDAGSRAGVGSMEGWLPDATPAPQREWARMYCCAVGRKP